MCAIVHCRRCCQTLLRRDHDALRQVHQEEPDKVAEVEFKMIAPSHGPIYDDPKFILNLYHDWVSGPCHNKVVLPFVSMHGSVRHMAEHLAGALTKQV